MSTLGYVGQETRYVRLGLDVGSLGVAQLSILAG